MRIALMAQDKKKEQMVRFCLTNAGILSEHKLYATGTTGKMVAECTGLPVHRYLTGRQGGEQQISVRIAYGELDMLIFFRDAENLNSFVSQNGLGEWAYVEADAESATVISEATYTIRCMDGDDLPVVGVMLQICDETTCQVVVTDENGCYAMTTSPYAWEVHILKTPAGYAANGEKDAILPEHGGEVTFVLEKE